MEDNMHNIRCIILSNVDDFRFLYPSIEQIYDIFKEIIIIVGEQRWTGEDEDMNKINKLKSDFSKYTSVKIMTYKVPDDIIHCVYKSVTPAMYWEAHARWMAYSELSAKDGYIVFLDADELIERQKFVDWLNTNEYLKYDGMKLANYWYWMKPTYRSKDYIEDSVVIIRGLSSNPMHLFSNLGRHGIFESVKGCKKRNIMFRNEPFIHHYSWVRTREQMLNKVKSWGHRDDNVPWVQLVEKEFEKNEEDEKEIRDFIKGLSYVKVDNIFNI